MAHRRKRPNLNSKLCGGGQLSGAAAGVHTEVLPSRRGALQTMSLHVLMLLHARNLCTRLFKLDLRLP